MFYFVCTFFLYIMIIYNCYECLEEQNKNGFLRFHNVSATLPPTPCNLFTRNDVDVSEHQSLQNISIFAVPLSDFNIESQMIIFCVTVSHNPFSPNMVPLFYIFLIILHSMLHHKVNDPHSILHLKVNDPHFILHHKVNDPHVILHHKVNDPHSILHLNVNDPHSILHHKVNDPHFILHRNVNDPHSMLHLKVNDPHFILEFEWMNTSFTFSTEISHYLVAIVVSNGTSVVYLASLIRSLRF